MTLTRVLYFNTCWHRTITARLSSMCVQDKQIKPNSSSVINTKSTDHSMLLLSTRSIHQHILTKRHLSSWTGDNFKLQGLCSTLPCLTKYHSESDTFTYFNGNIHLHARHYSSDVDHVPVKSTEEDGNAEKQEKIKRAPSETFIIQEQKWSKAIVKKLKNKIDFHDENTIILECNPGEGLLTRSLLMRTKVKVMCVQYKKKVSPSLKKLIDTRSYKDRVYLKHQNIVQVRKMLKSFVKLDGKEKQNKGSNIKIVGTTFPLGLYPQFISTLSYDLGYMNHIYSLGLVHIFLFVPASELQVLGVKSEDHLFNRKSLRSALYKLLFDVQVLMKIPREAFVKTTKNPKIDKDDSIYLIHLVPRSDIYDICAPQHIPSLISVLKTLRKKLASTVPNAIQSLYPVSTSDLENLGISATDMVRDMSSEDVINIHQLLVARNDFVHLDSEDVHEDINHELNDESSFGDEFYDSDTYNDAVDDTGLYVDDDCPEEAKLIKMH